MGFQLVVVQGRSASQVLKVGSAVMTVGRQQDCQLRIASSQVSRKHCQLFEKKGLLLVKDLGSSNGTLVNGKRIVDQRVLEPGDELEIGKVKFRIERIEDTVLMPGASKPSQSSKTGDTDISQAISGDDDVIEMGEAEIKEEPTTTSAGKAVAAMAPTVTTAAVPGPDDDAIEISEDAVADYLLNIELDDEDKL